MYKGYNQTYIYYAKKFYFLFSCKKKKIFEGNTPIIIKTLKDRKYIIALTNGTTPWSMILERKTMHTPHIKIIIIVHSK